MRWRHIFVRSKHGGRLLKAAVIMAALLLWQGSLSSCTLKSEAMSEERLYTYDDMEWELKVLASESSGFTDLFSLGRSYDGRELWCLRIGSETADQKVLITASIHAREYITTQLVMEQAKTWLANAANPSASYGGVSYRDMMEQCAIYLIPMVNPDGVAISQLGTAGLKTDAAKRLVYHIYELDGVIEINPYLEKWKANAEGVDLNRNFDALWEQYTAGPSHLSSDHYKGSAPGCCPESRALIELTEQERFDRTISYHTQGEVIYWYFGQTGQLYDESKAFAERIARVTGYRMDANYAALDPAGYKDWALSALHIPSITIETGTGSSPVPSSQFETILRQNRHVWEETVLSALASDRSEWE